MTQPNSSRHATMSGVDGWLPRRAAPARFLYEHPPVPMMGAMLGNEYASQNCSIARALEAVGERWTLLIVRELLRKPRRFSELERRLSVSKNILTGRLDKLVQLRIVETIPYGDTREWKTYRLTDKGRDLFPIIHALMAWGDVHEAPRGAPAILQHDCGRPAGHEVVCQACGGAVDAHTVRLLAGPGWDAPDAGARGRPGKS